MLKFDTSDLMAFPMETNKRLEEQYRDYARIKIVMETGYIDRSVAINERIPIIKENRLVERFSRDNPAEKLDTVLGLVHLRTYAPDTIQPFEEKALGRILPTLDKGFMEELQKRKLEAGRQLKEAYDAMPKEMSEDEKRLRLKYSEIGYINADFQNLLDTIRFRKDLDDIADLYKETDANLLAKNPEEYKEYLKMQELMNFNEEKFRSKSRKNRILHMKVVTDGEATSARMGKTFKRSDKADYEYPLLNERALLEEKEDRRLYDEFAMENSALFEKDIGMTAVYNKFKEYQKKRKANSRQTEPTEIINIPHEIVEEPVITIVHSKSKAVGEKENG